MRKKFPLAGMLAIAVVFWLTSALPLTARTDSTYDLLPIDAVLVLDVSRSMRTADPARISRDAMNMFIGMLTEGRDRVGVVAYAGQVERSRAMTTIRGDGDRASFEDFINQLEYASWTDHGLGLMEAMRIMSDGFDEGFDEGYREMQHGESPLQERQSVVIFFTDGNLNTNPNGPRSNARAQEDVDRAIEIAKERGFAIYAIGLNFDGNLAADYLYNIADATGGQFFETADAEDLPGIMQAIFAAMLTAAQEALETLEEPACEEPLMEEEPPILEDFPANGEAHGDSTPYDEAYPPEAENPEAENGNGILFTALGAGLALLTALIIFMKFQKPQRVFTGRLVLDTMNKPPVCRNLIEYGRRATLQKLLSGEISPALNSVILMPCPNAPSHLPQLIVKCKNPLVKFTKDFMPQDALRGIVITLGTEITVELEAGHKQIRMRYIT